MAGKKEGDGKGKANVVGIKQVVCRPMKAPALAAADAAEEAEKIAQKSPKPVPRNDFEQRLVQMRPRRKGAEKPKPAFMSDIKI